MIDERDMGYLRRCIELARQALETGNAPFGSMLVAAHGDVLFEGHNETASGDVTRHPEIEAARWACLNMTPEARAKATVYTSGEHCPMCAAAHGWAGLGRIVYASSSAQLSDWLKAWGVQRASVRALPIEQVLENARVEGPVRELEAEIRDLQWQYFKLA